jgi:3-oxoadipate enol-lactonase
MRQCGNGFGVIPRSFHDQEETFSASLQPRALTAIFQARPEAFSRAACRRFAWRKRAKQKQEKESEMPYAVTSDNVRLYFEEAGSGTPIIFLHEFAADHTNWEPQMRYFSRGHRCIAYSARGYTPSDVPSSPEVYTYEHFYTDALAVLDHLRIAKAHFIGLSMGSYSSLQIGLNAPERALSLTLAAVGSGSDLNNLEAFRKQCRANAEQYEAIGSVEVAKATREAPSRIPFLLKDPRGHADFYDALARHDAKGSANTMRSFQGGRPSIYTQTDAIRKVPTPTLIICGDEDDPCIGPSMFLKQHLPAAGLTFFPKSGHVLNLEEPALFNQMVERFIALAEAGRWPVRDPRSMAAG